MISQSFLIKPASGYCNMKCEYCFYADVTDIREIKNRGMMTGETLEVIVRKIMQEVSKFCILGFQGGEPTLAGLDFFRLLIDLEKKYNTKNIQIQHTLQTNGQLINDEWAAFFHEHQFLIGLSIDGGKEVHDSLRKDASQKGTHYQCLSATHLFQKHKVEFNILSVITKQLAEKPKEYWRFCKKEKFDFLQFIPCLDGLEQIRGSAIYSLDARTYGTFLCEIFDLWYNDYTTGKYISIRNFDNYIRILLGEPPENCAMAGECRAYPLIEADGSVYPCDFYAIDKYCLGNIKESTFTSMLNGEKADKFMRPSRRHSPECEKCMYLPLCRGGCRRDREVSGIHKLQLNYYCESYKQFFQHAFARMNQIAQFLKNR